MKKFILIILSLISLSGVAYAEVILTIQSHDYYSFRNTADDKLTGCGVQFRFDVTTPQDKKLVLSGVVYTREDVNPDDRISYKIFNVYPAESFNDKSTRLPVETYWIKAGDADSTNFRRVKSADQSTYAAVRPLKYPRQDLTMHFLTNVDYRFMGFLIRGEEVEQNLVLPPVSNDIYTEFETCMAELGAK